jgi:hypothetical protein
MRLAVVLVGLAGCNQVFDLKPTVSIDAPGAPDVDDDGVADALDNCPTLANSDQANADDDGFGDACDTCPMTASSSVHNEDRDRFGDDCDLCPGTPDFGADGDNDTVGDLCDPLPDKAGQPNHRVQFDPFLTLPSDWSSSTVAWTQQNDAIAPVMVLDPTDPGLHNASISTSGSWRVTVGLEASEHWDASDSYSIVGESAGGERVECRVECVSDATTTKCIGAAINNGSNVRSTGIVPQPRTSIGIEVANNGAPICMFGSAKSAAGVAPTNGMQIWLRVSPRVRATYVDYVN